MKFLVPNYSCLQNPWLGDYRPQIPVLSVLCHQLNLLNPPPPEQNSWVRHCCTGLAVHRVGRGIALLFLDHSTRRGSVVSVTPRPLFTSRINPVPIVQETGWAPGPVWTGAENLASTGIRSPDRPDRSQSLHRLSYPAHVILSTLMESYWFVPQLVLFALYSLVSTTNIHTQILARVSDLLNARACTHLL